ncbi:ATP-binding protein [Bradyrhizobium sp. U531]|uniref:PAS domain-containing sensor histidine kinase n=1 Tax=Bradyrhizobium sp. U531 TaxID=3053458 RepID=UPI003F427C5A
MPKATHSPDTGAAESLLKLITDRGAIEFDHEREGAWIEVIRKMDEVYSDLLRYEVDLEHKNAELEEAQAFVTNVIESVSDILIVCDAKGLVQQVNSAFQRTLGRSSDEIVSWKMAEVIDPADNVKLVSLLSPRGTSDVVDGELRFLTRDGSSDLFAINSSPRHDHRGRFIGVVLTGRPIGELRRAYEALHKAHQELQRAQRQLIEQEKMASLGRLVAGVAHELNNPISFVYGNVHTLMRYRTALTAYLDAVHGNGERRQDAEALRKRLRIGDILEDLGPLLDGTMEGAVRISEIVKNLRRLSFSKLGEVERVNIQPMINTAVLWAARTRKTRLDIQMDIEPDLWISGNEGQLHQVIVNLVENAIDAMRSVRSPRLAVCASRRGNDILVHISDNGPGIDAQNLGRIFEPFFTTKRVGEGTGLGLWISYGIVREHGGELTGVNAPEGGAIFSFALPAA